VTSKVSPVSGRAIWYRPGHVKVTLNAEHRRAYLRLYGMYFPLSDVPALKDHDFDGRAIRMTRRQLAALNRNLQDLSSTTDTNPVSPFREQEDALTTASHEMQFLS
jgi:hypothetical protein